MSLLDTFIASLSPALAVKRARSQQVLEIINEHKDRLSTRNFEAAGRGRRTDGWRVSSASPFDEVSPSLNILRLRARQLANNNSWVKKGAEVIANNTIGSGIRPAISNKRTLKAWKLWAESVKCDYYGRTNFYGLQWQVAHTVARSGECLIIRHDAPNGPRLQILEGDYLDQGKNYVALRPSDNYIVDGVEFTPDGIRVAYWVYESNPMKFKSVSQRILADRVIHVYESLRPGQIRGIPAIHAVMLTIRDFDDYQDAQLLKQKIAACYAAFVTEAGNEGGLVGAKDDEMDIPDSIEPGMVSKLAPGQDITFADPPSTDGYGDYSRNQLLAIAAGMGITYEALTGDMSNVNFSSGRMGWLEMHRNVCRWQSFSIIPLVCHTTWEWFNNYAILNGLVNTPQVDWSTPKRDMIDPSKEIAALGDAVRFGFVSYDEALRQQGFEPNAVVDEIAERNKYLDQKKVMLVSDPRYFPSKAGPATAAEPATLEVPE
jgi:lambda family phage portal protein